VRLFKNLGKTNKSDKPDKPDYEYNYKLNNIQPRFQINDIDKFIIPIIVVNSNNTQLLQVTLEDPAAMTPKTGYLWKQVQRTIQLS